MGYVGKKPTAAPLTASDVTDGIISNAKLAQDVISAETALAVAPADTDEFLLSDAGTLKRIDYSLIKSDPTNVLLSTTNISSGTANVDITSNIDSTYKIYMIDLINLHFDTDAVNFNLRFFQSGVIDSSGYDWCYYKARSTSSTASLKVGENQSIIRMSDSLDNLNESSINGRLLLFNPSDTTFNTHIRFNITAQENGDTLEDASGSGRIEQTEAVDGLRFFMSSGNLDSGIIKLYGVN